MIEDERSTKVLSNNKKLILVIGTTDQVFDVGSIECPGPEPLNATIHSMRNEIMKTLLTVFKTNDSFTSMMARLTLGLVMFLHGAQKVLGWFGGYGFSATMNFFTGQLHIPALLAFIAIVAEFLGSIGLIAGFLSRVSAFGIAIVMLVAAFMVHAPNGFFMNWAGNQKGEGFEYHLLAIGLALVVIISGAGKWSIDRLLTGRLEGHRVTTN